MTNEPQCDDRRPGESAVAISYTFAVRRKLPDDRNAPESGLDGFICAVLWAPNTIMPSEWMRWVWDQKEGEQSPEFASEKQAKRILSLLIGHANVLAFTLTHGPQHYEPLFSCTQG